MLGTGSIPRELRGDVDKPRGEISFCRRRRGGGGVYVFRGGFHHPSYPLQPAIFSNGVELFYCFVAGLSDIAAGFENLWGERNFQERKRMVRKQISCE